MGKLSMKQPITTSKNCIVATIINVGQSSAFMKEVRPDEVV